MIEILGTYHHLLAYNTLRGVFMNINKVLSFISENNISPEAVFQLVEKVKGMDFTDENNIRRVIRDVAKIANKPVDRNKENQIVKEIMKNGVSDNLFKMI